MKEKLQEIINEFGESLTLHEYNQYVTKLRDYLIPYIINKKEDFTIERLFRDEFRRSDIVNATIYYVKMNQNVESISAVDDYLIAINRLFEELLFDRYPNPTLEKIKPFTSFSDEVQKILISNKIFLREREVYPAISEEQFKFIIQYLKNHKWSSIKSIQVNIIIKIMLLYGFSQDKIAGFNTNDYDANKKTLKVEYKRAMNRSVYLELPYSLSKNIDSYISLRNKSDKLNSNLLFITENNKKITSGFLKYNLDLIKNEFIKVNGEHLYKNQFTSTGLQKYAIVQMILDGMNQSVIMDLTGQQGNIYEDCQNEVNIIKELNRNRYVNHIIRGIKTYDEI